MGSMIKQPTKPMAEQAAVYTPPKYVLAAQALDYRAKLIDFAAWILAEVDPEETDHRQHGESMVDEWLRL